MPYQSKEMFSNPMGRKMASEVILKASSLILHCIMISNINLGFCDRDMFPNHIKTKLTSKNIIWRRRIWITCIKISNLQLGFYDEEMFSNSMQTKLASENDCESVGFDYAIWILNNSFDDKEMLSNPMRASWLLRIILKASAFFIRLLWYQIKFCLSW